MRILKLIIGSDAKVLRAVPEEMLPYWIRQNWSDVEDVQMVNLLTNNINNENWRLQGIYVIDGQKEIWLTKDEA